MGNVKDITKRMENLGKESEKITKEEPKKSKSIKSTVESDSHSSKKTVSAEEKASIDKLENLNGEYNEVVVALGSKINESNLRLQEAQESIKNNEGGVPESEKSSDLIKSEQKVLALEKAPVPIFDVNNSDLIPPTLPPRPKKLLDAIQTGKLREDIRRKTMSLIEKGRKSINLIEKNEKVIDNYEDILEKFVKGYEESKEKLSGKDEQERKLIESLNNIHSKYIKKNPNEKDRYLDFCSDLKKCLEDNVLKRKKSLGSHFKSSSSNSMSKDIIKLLEYAGNILKGKNLKSNKNKFDKSCKNIINSLEKLKNKKSGDHMPLFAKSKINKVLTEIVSSLEKDISNYCE